MQYDAAIVGLGAMGSAALAHAARRGRRVIGIEQYGPAHALGASHGKSRTIRQAYYEDSAYVPFVQRAYELWEELQRESGEEIWKITGALYAGRPDAPVVAGALRSAVEHGLAHEVWEAAHARARYPLVRPLDDEIVVYEPTAGVLFPERCVLAHLQRATASGAHARFGVGVEAWNERGGAIELRLSDGERIVAERLVLCTGAWLPALAGSATRVRVERNTQHWFASATPATVERFPVFNLDRPGRPMFYGFPDFGDGIKVAFHHSGLYIDAPQQLDRNVEGAEVAEAAAALRSWAPDVIGEHRRSSACMYAMTPDENFLIGQHAASSHALMVGGFSGHGFKFASAVGELVAQLLCGETAPYALPLFDPGRFAATRI